MVFFKGVYCYTPSNIYLFNEKYEFYTFVATYLKGLNSIYILQGQKDVKEQLCPFSCIGHGSKC